MKKTMTLTNIPIKNKLTLLVKFTYTTMIFIKSIYHGGMQSGEANTKDEHKDYEPIFFHV